MVKEHNVTRDDFESVVQYLSRTEDEKSVALNNMIPEYVKLLRLLLTIPRVLQNVGFLHYEG